MTYHHRMPTARRAMEKHRFNSAIRKMTLEDQIVKRIWDGDVREVTLFTAGLKIAQGLLDDGGGAGDIPATSLSAQLEDDPIPSEKETLNV